MKASTLLAFVVLCAITFVPTTSAFGPHNATSNAADPRDTNAPGVGGPILGIGDESRVGAYHEVGLGGQAYIQHGDEAVELHWAQGITRCWITIPTDGSPASGPHCVY